MTEVRLLFANLDKQRGEIVEMDDVEAASWCARRLAEPVEADGDAPLDLDAMVAAMRTLARGMPLPIPVPMVVDEPPQQLEETEPEAVLPVPENPSRRTGRIPKMKPVNRRS